MTRPKRNDIQIPLLYQLEKVGGKAPWKEVVEALVTQFPQMTRNEMVESGGRKYTKWEGDVRWASYELKKKGEIERGTLGLGIWSITEKGREWLRNQGLVPKGGGEEVAKELRPDRHTELKQKMVEIGTNLGYYTSTEEGYVYRHDILWKRGQYKQDPGYVIEVCAGGSLPKDFDALNWANENLGAKGILVAVDEVDYRKAIQRFINQPNIVVVKAETVDRLHELMKTDLEFIKFIFTEKP